MSSEPQTATNIPMLKTIRCPGSLKGAARALKTESGAVTTHQKSALYHAVRCGALLHYAKSLVKHGEWLPWLEKNFDGHGDTARDYMRVACAYSVNSPIFTNCGSIDSALQIARDLPKATDLPPILPSIMEPIRLKAVPPVKEESPQSPQSIDNDDSIETDEEILGDIRRAREARLRQERERKEPPHQKKEKEVNGYPVVLSALDAVARAQGALQSRPDLVVQMKEAHQIIRRVVSELHLSGMANV